LGLEGKTNETKQDSPTSFVNLPLLLIYSKEYVWYFKSGEDCFILNTSIKSTGKKGRMMVFTSICTASKVVILTLVPSPNPVVFLFFCVILFLCERDAKSCYHGYTITRATDFDR